MMDRRVAVVAYGQVDQAQGGGHIAHQATNHSTAETASAAAMRAGALMASRVVPGETGSCMDQEAGIATYLL